MHAGGLVMSTPNQGKPGQEKLLAKQHPHACLHLIPRVHITCHLVGCNEKRQRALQRFAHCPTALIWKLRLKCLPNSSWFAQPCQRLHVANAVAASNARLAVAGGTSGSAAVFAPMPLVITRHAWAGIAVAPDMPKSGDSCVITAHRCASCNTLLTIMTWRQNWRRTW